MRWYIGIPVLRALLAVNPTVTTRTFDNPNTYVAITNPSQLSEIPAGWSSVVVETFFDGTQLQNAVASGQIPSPVKGVVLDDEKGNHNLTPMAEQLNPVPLEQTGANLARQHGLQFLDVGEAPATGPAGRYHAAQYAGVVDLQVQRAQSQLSRFDAMVSDGVAAFHHVNPGVLVLVGIAADASGGVSAGAEQMLKAVQTTRSVAGGYWLNCTPCTSQDASAATQFLNLLATG
jgi:hypothetical protein